MRIAIAFLSALVSITFVGCGGTDKATAPPLPVAQRFITAEDAPGSKPDPVETRQTTTDYDEFTLALAERAVDAKQDEIDSAFKKADFKEAGEDARFFGATHQPNIPHVFSSEIELTTEDAAASALDWLETDSLKPCPMSCAVQRSKFDVNDISGARGVHRSASAEDIKSMGGGTGDEMPFDSYWIGFTIGPVVYTMELHGPPGSISEDRAQEIASAYYDRLTGG